MTEYVGTSKSKLDYGRIYRGIIYDHKEIY